MAALDAGLKKQPEARARLEKLKELSRLISQGLYRLVGDLRPAQLDDLGLVPAINYLLERARGSTDIEFALKAQGSPRRLDPAVETVLFRIAQEAITNITRHSRARQACIDLCFEECQVRLTVADQGKGFDPGGSFSAPRGWGLEGMRERAAAAGGSLTIDSAPGRGTTISAAIPLADHHNVPPLSAKEPRAK